MACFSVGRPQDSPEDGVKIHAVVEFHLYEPDSTNLEEMVDLHVLGLFFVEVSEDEAHFEVVHPDDMEQADCEAVDLRRLPEGGPSVGYRVLSSLKSLLNAGQQTEQSAGRDVCRQLKSNVALKLLSQQAGSFFRLCRDGTTMAYAKTAPFRDGGGTGLEFTVPEDATQWERVVTPHISNWGLAPVTCFRSGPLPKGRHLVSILLHLPVQKMTAWSDVAEQKLWIMSPPGFLNGMRKLCECEEDVTANFKEWLDGWEKRAMSPDSYFAVIMPVSENRMIPFYEIFGSSAFSVCEVGARSDVQVVGCYRLPSSFEVLVEPGLKLLARRRYRQEANAAESASTNHELAEP